MDAELDGFDEALVGELGHPHQLAVAADGAGCIGGDRGVIGFDLDGEVVK